MKPLHRPESLPGGRPGPQHQDRSTAQRQGGLSLLEALVAAAVLALGLHGALRLGVQGLQLGRETTERLQAQQLALHSLECHAGGWDETDEDCAAERQVLLQGVRYQVSLTREAGAAPGLERLQVTVRWQGVLPAASAPGGPSSALPGTDTTGPAGSSDVSAQRLQLWREVAQVPRWRGVSSP